MLASSVDVSPCYSSNFASYMRAEALMVMLCYPFFELKAWSNHRCRPVAPELDRKLSAGFSQPFVELLDQNSSHRVTETQHYGDVPSAHTERYRENSSLRSCPDDVYQSIAGSSSRHCAFIRVGSRSFWCFLPLRYVSVGSRHVPQSCYHRLDACYACSHVSNTIWSLNVR